MTSEVKKYVPANGFTDAKMEVVASIVVDHAIRAVGVGDIGGVLRETVKATRLAQDILIALDLLVPEGEEGA